MKYVVDSSSWIDYLEGNKNGEKVNDILKTEEIFVLPINIAEVVSKVKRKKNNFELAYDSIISNASVINITPKIAKEAGILHAELKSKIFKFGLADSLIITATKSISAKLITGDEHFRRFKEAVIIN